MKYPAAGMLTSLSAFCSPGCRLLEATRRREVAPRTSVRLSPFLASRSSKCASVHGRQSVGSWRKASIAVQSGSCESVIDAVEKVRGCEDNDIFASKKALTYASANGVAIPTLSEMVVPIQTEENTNRSIKLQAATVTRPVASANRIWWCLIRSAA